MMFETTQIVRDVSAADEELAEEAARIAVLRRGGEAWEGLSAFCFAFLDKWMPDRAA
jgi:hypothetical protein